MIIGIGTDIVEVERIAQKIQKNIGFKELVFANAEINYCETKKHVYQHFAARFAAKEAFFKALGTGWANGTHFNEVVVLDEAEGKPYIQLLGETKNTLQHLNTEQILLSISHTPFSAIAFVIIQDK